MQIHYISGSITDVNMARVFYVSYVPASLGVSAMLIISEGEWSFHFTELSVTPETWLNWLQYVNNSNSL